VSGTNLEPARIAQQRNSYMATPANPNAVETLLIPYAGVSPTIDPQAWVAPTAVLVGDVTVSAAASIFYGAVVRADMAAVSIGKGANLQDNVVVHTASGYPTVIGPGVSVGHAAVVHGCTIEAGCLIGMKATILNGAVIGAGSLVAAGTVVLEGARIPPRSLVAGIPGRVRRELWPQECDEIEENARMQLDLAARTDSLPGRT
jgi:carbonic anhydrase/acetyltransferase-like protein (isoleucine patch superfamily)